MASVPGFILVMGAKHRAQDRLQHHGSCRAKDALQVFPWTNKAPSINQMQFSWNHWNLAQAIVLVFHTSQWSKVYTRMLKCINSTTVHGITYPGHWRVTQASAW